VNLLAAYMTVLGVVLLALGAIIDVRRGGWEGKTVGFLGMLAILTCTFLGQ